MIKHVLDTMLDRILELDVRNTKKSVEYGYLEKDVETIKDDIYKAALRSLNWSIKEIFDDLVVDYAN